MRLRIRSLLLSAALAASLNAFALDINTASQAQLEQVKGIGVAMSDRLLKARDDAPFADWPDLMARVNGIAPRTARRLSEQGVTVAGQPFEVPSPPTSPSR